MQNKMNACDGLLYFMTCFLHNAEPDQDVMQMVELERLYHMAAAHSVEAMICMAIEKTESFLNAEPAITKQWKEAKNKAIRKMMLLDEERKQIFSEMDRAEIWHMPLKGVLLKELYPKYGARQMADNDILFDKSKRSEVKDIMVKRGYKVKAYGKSNHDIFEKKPVYNYELHVALFGRSNKKGQAYYENVKERLVADAENSYSFHFTEDDFYIYFIEHAFKHFENSGTGIRFLADIYVFLKKKGNELDWNYIKTELNKLGAGEFEEKSRTLAVKLFSDIRTVPVALNGEERELLETFMGSGTYGTIEKYVKNSFAKMQTGTNRNKGKIKVIYLWRRLIPDREWFECNAPFYWQHKWLIPGFIIWRIIRGIGCRKKAIFAEINAVKKM